MTAHTKVGKRLSNTSCSRTFPYFHSDLPGASHTLACAHMHFGVRLSTKITDCNSVSPSVSPPLFFPLRVLWRVAAISHVCVILTMLLLVVLGTVFSFTVVTTERAENTSGKTPAPPLNYSRISLPPEHVPYFLNNNKKVAKKCRLDPLCPFKVRYASRQLLRLFSLYCGSMLAALFSWVFVLTSDKCCIGWLHCDFLAYYSVKIALNFRFEWFKSWSELFR